MEKSSLLDILESAKDENADIPMSLVRLAFEKLPEPCEDAVSRQAVIDFVNSITKLNPKVRGSITSGVKAMPPVTPVLPECEGTKDCRDCLFSGRPPYKSPCSECRNKSMWEMRQ